MSLAKGFGFKFVYLFLAITLVVTAAALGVGRASAADDPGAVYTISNATAGNEVVVFDRAADGSLTLRGSVSTGGLGTGANLGSQGALVLSDNNRWLFAVNAGSDSISAFEVKADGLYLVATFASGGVRPISLTMHGSLLYVLNAGGSGNIAGFSVKNGIATAIPGSSQPLSNNGVGAAPGPAQIQFNASGTVLVVTEKATSLIDTYLVGKSGAAAAPVTYPSAGAVPFGFDIDRQNHVIVSEAAGGMGGTGASSYSLGKDGSLSTLSAAVPNGQGAACWLVISKDGRFAYTANAATDNISGYDVAPDGTITLMAGGGVTATGMQPLDMDLSNSGRYLYVIDGRADTIQGYRVESNGSLTLVGSAPVPATAIGLAAE